MVCNNKVGSKSRTRCVFEHPFIINNERLLKELNEAKKDTVWSLVITFGVAWKKHVGSSKATNKL